MKKTITTIAISLLLAGVFIKMCSKAPITPEPPPPVISKISIADSLRIAERYQEQIEDLKTENLALRDSSRKYWSKAQSVVAKARWYIIHDTNTVRYRDTGYCRSVEMALLNCAKSHEMDSCTIVNYEQSIMLCDSTRDILTNTIHTADTINSQLTSAYNYEKTEHRKESARANKAEFGKSAWRAVSIIQTAIFTTLMIFK